MLVDCESPLDPATCPTCRRSLSASEMVRQSRWYYSANRKKIGPVSWSQLHYQAIGGRLQPEDMVLRDGAAKWVPAGSLPDLFATKSGSESATVVEFMLDPTETPAQPPHKHRRSRPVQILPWDRQFFWYSVGLAAGAVAIALWVLFAK